MGAERRAFSLGRRRVTSSGGRFSKEAREAFRDDLLSYHVVRMAIVRNTRRVRGVSKVRENSHWQKKQRGPPLVHSSEGGPGAIACFGRSLASEPVSVHC